MASSPDLSTGIKRFSRSLREASLVQLWKRSGSAFHASMRLPWVRIVALLGDVRGSFGHQAQYGEELCIGSISFATFICCRARTGTRGSHCRQRRLQPNRGSGDDLSTSRQPRGFHAWRANQTWDVELPESPEDTTTALTRGRRVSQRGCSNHAP